MAALPLAARIAMAQEGNPLVQSGILAEATAGSAVQARERAHAEARRIAFQRLAQALGTSAPTVSDATLEGWTSAMIVEQERNSPTRYAGRLTVRFSPAAAAAMGRTVAAPQAPPGLPMVEAAPPVAQVTATAAYLGLDEWRELRAKLRASGQVAGLDLLAIRTNGAVMRLHLRAAASEAQAALLGAGIAVEASGDEWRISLARGG
jgi:hypothetical protein